MRFANDFHSWLRHSWKLLANRLTHDPKIVIHGNPCIILYIHAGIIIYIKPKQKIKKGNLLVLSQMQEYFNILLF